MKIKQKLAVFLTGTLLVGLLGSAALAAQPEMQLELQFTPAAVGETATAQLVCENNPGLASAQFTLAFDDTVLDCTDVTTGRAIRGMMVATNPDGAEGAIVAAASASGVERDGVLAYFDFTVLREGDCKFVLKNTYFTLEDGTQVSFSVSGLDHVVENDRPNVPVQPDVPDEPDEPVVPDEPDQPGGEIPGTTEEVETTEIPFHDIAGHWAESHVLTAADRGLVKGYPDGGVHPDHMMNRAEFVTVLWRHAGSPKPTAPATFKDLSPNGYYLDAVAWAQEMGYVKGMSDTEFVPMGLINRQMVVTVLHRMSGQTPGGELLWSSIYDQSFIDSETVSDWAKSSVYWAVYNEILCGQNSVAVGEMLYPIQTASRAEIMVMLINYQNRIGGAER